MVMSGALIRMQERIRELEGDEAVGKGQLLTLVLAIRPGGGRSLDPEIDWDSIFQALELRGRHRRKQRWRRALIQENLRRSFPCRPDEPASARWGAASAVRLRAGGEATGGAGVSAAEDGTVVSESGWWVAIWQRRD